MAYKDNKKEEGSLVQPFICVLLLAFIAMLITYSMRLATAEYASVSIKNGLNAAVMSGIIIDEDVLSYSDDIVISEETENGIYASYASFLDSLKDNLNLDDSLASSSSALVSGSSISVDSYRIYNVYGSDVAVIDINPTTGTLSSVSSGMVGDITTPGGSIVTASGVYVEISYEQKGMFGNSQTITKTAFIDTTAD